MVLLRWLASATPDCIIGNWLKPNQILAGQKEKHVGDLGIVDEAGITCIPRPLQKPVM